MKKKNNNEKKEIWNFLVSARTNTVELRVLQNSLLYLCTESVVNHVQENEIKGI